jgi:hypothetical protein
VHVPPSGQAIAIELVSSGEPGDAGIDAGIDAAAAAPDLGAADLACAPEPACGAMLGSDPGNLLAPDHNRFSVGLTDWQPNSVNYDFGAPMGPGLQPGCISSQSMRLCGTATSNQGLLLLPVLPSTRLHPGDYRFAFFAGIPAPQRLFMVATATTYTAADGGVASTHRGANTMIGVTGWQEVTVGFSTSADADVTLLMEIDIRLSEADRTLETSDCVYVNYARLMEVTGC